MTSGHKSIGEIMNTETAYPFGRYLENFKEGDIYRHCPGKTITESDNNLFSLLTMNHHPLHLNIEYAKLSQHQKVVVVGTLVFSLVVGMTVRDVSGKAIVNLGYQNIYHVKPVYINDTLYAETTVIEVRASKTKFDRGIVKVETRAYNQNNELVIKFSRRILIPKKPNR